MKYLILLLVLTACGSNTDNTGPSACEKQLYVCKLDLQICNEKAANGSDK